MANNPQSSKPLSGSDYRRTLATIGVQIDVAIEADSCTERRLPPNARAAMFSTVAANVRDLILDLTQREAETRR